MKQLRKGDVINFLLYDESPCRGTVEGFSRTADMVVVLLESECLLFIDRTWVQDHLT